MVRFIDSGQRVVNACYETIYVVAIWNHRCCCKEKIRNGFKGIRGKPKSSRMVSIGIGAGIAGLPVWLYGNGCVLIAEFRLDRANDIAKNVPEIELGSRTRSTMKGSG